MAEYRTIRMSFWNDPYIEELEPKIKLLYIYLFTSPYTNNLGILEATRRKIAFETGLSAQDVDKGLEKLERDRKIVCDDSFNLVFIVRFIKHQTTTSPKLIQGMQKLAVSIPSEKIARTVCILYPQVYGVKTDGMDTVSIPYADGLHTLCIPSGEIGIWNLEVGIYCGVVSEEPTPQETSPTVFSLPLNTGTMHDVTEADVDRWEKIYPSVDVRNELRRMLGWLDGNPKNRKTESGINRFITSWLDREQNRGHNRDSPSQHAPKYGQAIN